jgi:histidinol dehydrogenase
MRVMPAEQFALGREIDDGTAEQQEAVKAIIAQVRQEGDKALTRLTLELDKVEVTDFRVKEEEIRAAYDRVDDAFLTAIRLAAENIRKFHEKQKRNSWFDVQPDGTLLGQMIRPLRRVGMYVPGGRAAYPSSLLMNVIPAQVAGVQEIVLTTPPATAGVAGIDPHILVAAAEVGVREIYRAGGAQAIAALAYGTETIRPVDKITGPGNIYVALAKRFVYGVVDIDSMAGPSEIAVVADDSADPSYVAADLLSQAEHDELASAILITPSQKLADLVQREIARQLEALPRRAIAAKSVQERGAILLADSMEVCFDTLNRLAPEHVELLIEEPFAWLGAIRNAGAVFIGPFSPEPVGDYFAGPNHVLPTNGTARFFSPLNVDDFVKKSSVIYYSKEALLANGEHIVTLAKHEGLEGHARAIELRLKKEGKTNVRP